MIIKVQLTARILSLAGEAIGVGSAKFGSVSESILERLFNLVVAHDVVQDADEDREKGHHYIIDYE